MPQLTAIVTGANGGIGQGIILELISKGYKVHGIDLQFSTNSEGLICHEADLSDSESINRVVEEILSDSPTIDVLVNCAGVMRRGAATELSPADWSFTLAVNLNALVQLCTLIIPHMVQRGQGSIINIASQWGLHPARGHAAYNASKAAVIAFTRSVAKDYGAQGIRANSICPGEILTPMVEQKLIDSGQSEEDLAANIPIGRLGRPRDVAKLVAFLSSEDSSFISGAAIEITGAQEVS